MATRQISLHPTSGEETEHMATIATRRHRNGKTWVRTAAGVLLALGGAAILTALAVGLDSRRSTGDKTPAAAPEVSTVQPRASGGLPTTTFHTPVLYLVDTQEQADWVRRFAYEMGQVSGSPAAVGAVVLPHTVTGAEVAGLPRAPGTQVIDLRRADRPSSPLDVTMYGTVLPQDAC